MTKNQINRMGEIAATIATLNAELDELKAMARTEANGEAVSFTGDACAVTVTKPGKPGIKFDVVAFEKRAPQAYAEAFKKYQKPTSGRAAAVNVVLKK